MSTAAQEKGGGKEGGVEQDSSSGGKSIGGADFDIVAFSNCCPEDISDSEAVRIEAGNAARRALGYNARGELGGAFSRENPPPGMIFEAYRKGYTGINWKKVAGNEEVSTAQQGN